MRSFAVLMKWRKSEQEIEREQTFIAQHGDLRLSPLKHHREGGQQYFDSADWSMVKDNIREELKISSLPKKKVATRPDPVEFRKSTLINDSARSLLVQSARKQVVSDKSYLSSAVDRSH